MEMLEPGNNGPKPVQNSKQEKQDDTVSHRLANILAVVHDDVAVPKSWSRGRGARWESAA